MANRFVQKLQGFAGLTPVAIAAFETVTAHPSEVAAKQDLIREGDRPGLVLVIIDGWAYRYKILPNGLRQVTAFLMPGDACDLHVGMLDEMDHSIRTMTSARVATVSRHEMDRIMTDHSGVTRAMYVVQLTDEATLRAWIVSMIRRTSAERVVHLKCELYAQTRWIGLVHEEEFTLPETQIVLADALWMTAVRINRILRQFRIAGIITLNQGSLTSLIRESWRALQGSMRIIYKGTCVIRRN